MRRVCMAMIRFYQRHISPHFPAVCRFRPTCSQYTLTAVERYGAVGGIWLGFLRICRCNPWAKGGWDPVPLRFDIFGRHRTPVPDPLSPAQRTALGFGWLLAPRTRYQRGMNTRGHNFPRGYFSDY